MNLRYIRASERRRFGLGAAIEYELTLDHMGAAIGKSTASVYLGPGDVMALQDAIGAAAGGERDEVIGRLWIALDGIVDRLTDMGEPADLDSIPDRNLEAWREAFHVWAELRGQAQGLAVAIALLTSPRYPAADWVRAEAARRWDTRHR